MPIYGVYDLSLTPSQRNWGDNFLVLSTPSMHWFGRCFVGERTTDELRDPDLSPLYADLRDLPPALFLVGIEYREGDAQALLDAANATRQLTRRVDWRAASRMGARRRRARCRASPFPRIVVTQFPTALPSHSAA